MKKTIKIKCKCGQQLTVPSPGKKTCPKCGTVYTVTDEEIKWKEASNG